MIIIISVLPQQRMNHILYPPLLKMSVQKMQSWQGRGKRTILRMTPSLNCSLLLVWSSQNKTGRIHQKQALGQFTYIFDTVKLLDRVSNDQILVDPYRKPSKTWTIREWVLVSTTRQHSEENHCRDHIGDPKTRRWWEQKTFTKSIISAECPFHWFSSSVVNIQQICWFSFARSLKSRRLRASESSCFQLQIK